MPARTRTPAAEPASEPEQAAEADPGGFFRNTGATDLTVLDDGATPVLAPGRIAPLTRTPTHRDLAAASEADFKAQQDADRAAEAAPDAAGDATPTSETEV